MYYEMSRKLWFGLYGLVWASIFTVYLTDASLGVCIALSVVALGFVTLTDPAPRNAPLRASHSCNCDRCEQMRAQHNRRRTDVKDAG